MIEEAAQQFIDEFQGTCRSAAWFEFNGIGEYIDTLSWDDQGTFWAIVENSIFLCETCGWWRERSEESMNEADFGSCTDCCPDDEE